PLTAVLLRRHPATRETSTLSLHDALPICPDALLPTMGGQTALNLALALHEDGTLDRLGIELIGAKPDVIERAEDREKFQAVMEEDRKSTRLNSSHVKISYAVFCLKKKKRP